MKPDFNLTIQHVRVRPLDLGLSKPVETASGVMKTTPLVLIDVLTEEGIVGSSYVRCYTPLALDALARLLVEVGKVLVGQSAAPAQVGAKLNRHFRLLGPQGLTGAAAAGIDMALWDARARMHGLPLVTLLGGAPGPVDAYASLRTMSPEGAAAEAEEAMGMGFRAVKVKLGRADVAADLQTLRAVRRAVGSSVRIMVDYNQSLSVVEAIARARALEDYDVYWVEEPTRADDFVGHAHIAARSQTAIQLGENWWGPSDMLKSLRAQASDHVMLDVMKLGGVTGWLRAAALADAWGAPASSHAFPEFSSHLLGVTPTAHYLEYLDHAGPILLHPVRIEEGKALISDRPGAGIEWNEQVIEKVAS